jgi:uncharacterized membrane protein
MRRFLLWLCICALALRLIGIAASLLWYDEAYTVAISHLPIPQMLAAIRGDVHPPLWYIIEWIMIRIGGTNPFIMRLPSALFGTASVAETYQLVKRFGGEKPAQWAGVIMAALPGQIYYSQEARMYSLLTLLVLMGARAIKDKNWLRLGLTCAAILYTQNIGYVYVGILSAWGLITGRAAAFKKLSLGAVLYSPWLVTAIDQMRHINQSFWLSFRPSLGAPLYMLSFTTVFTRLPQDFYIHGIALSIAVTLVALIGMWGKFKRYAPMLALGFGPPILLYLISLVWKPVLLDRALLPSGAALAAIWGAGLSNITGWSRKALAALAVPLAMVALVTYYTDPTNQRQKDDPISDTIVANWQPGDVMYHVTLESYILYDYYLPGRPSYALPEAGDLAQSLTDNTKIAMGIKSKELIFSQLRQMGYKRAWLFIVTNPVTSDYEINQASYITDHWPTVQEWTFQDTDISKFKLAIIDTHAITLAAARDGDTR